MDYRLLLSGYLPEYLYRIGARASGQRAGYRDAGRYTDRARATADAAQFSQYPPGRARRMRRAFLPRADCPRWGQFSSWDGPAMKIYGQPDFCKRGGVGVNWACSNLFGVSWG